jgi:hypothetical protein
MHARITRTRDRRGGKQAAPTVPDSLATISFRAGVQQHKDLADTSTQQFDRVAPRERPHMQSGGMQRCTHCLKQHALCVRHRAQHPGALRSMACPGRAPPQQPTNPSTHMRATAGCFHQPRAPQTHSGRAPPQAAHTSSCAKPRGLTQHASHPTEPRERAHIHTRARQCAVASIYVHQCLTAAPCQRVSSCCWTGAKLPSAAGPHTA